MLREPSDAVFDELPVRELTDSAVHNPVSTSDWQRDLSSAAVTHYGMQTNASLLSRSGMARIGQEYKAAEAVAQTALQSGESDTMDALTLHEHLQTVLLPRSFRVDATDPVDATEIRIRDARAMWNRTLPNILAVRSIKDLGMMDDAKIMGAFNGSDPNRVFLQHAYRFRKPVSSGRIQAATQSQDAVAKAFEMGLLPSPELVERAISEGNAKFSRQELDYLQWFLAQLDPENEHAVSEPLLNALTVMDGLRMEIAPLLRGDENILQMPGSETEPEATFLDRINA